MKTNYGQKAAYLGAGIGIVLFALYGLMPGAFVGGVMGLSVAGKVFGEATVLLRAAVALGMLLGVLSVGSAMVGACGSVGYLAGRAIDYLGEPRHKHADALVTR